MIAELPITMLACARLGVIHSQVFGGFSGNACADRIVDSGSRVLITMDAYYRSGKLLDHKQNADIAVRPGRRRRPEGRQGPGLAALPRQIFRPTPMVEGRDYFVNDLFSRIITAPGSNRRR
jgi:acetyl-CoA synthetase